MLSSFKDKLNAPVSQSKPPPWMKTSLLSLCLNVYTKRVVRRQERLCRVCEPFFLMYSILFFRHGIYYSRRITRPQLHPARRTPATSATGSCGRSSSSWISTHAGSARHIQHLEGSS